MNYTSVAHCGHEHQEWIKAMDFYKDDLQLLQKRLMEIAGKNNGHDTMAEVEHFQNQFIVQRNNIDELRHSIKEHENVVAADARVHAGKMESSHSGRHAELKDQVVSFEKIFNELRHEFNIFLSKWM